MDPRAAAAERLASQQGLLAGKDVADETALMRMLQSRGLLGAANYNPGVEGIAPSTTPMNPHLAAFYAGRGARDARMAAESLEAGEGQVERGMRRAALGQQARAGIPSKAAGQAKMLKDLYGMAKETGVTKDIGGMLGRGADWLGRTTGLWNLDPYSGGQGTDFGEWYGW